MLPEVSTVERALDALPVFPLPTAVLLPTEVMPLHIFEPRYRALVRDALEADGVIAIASFAPGWEGSYEGRPRLEPVCGAGVIVRHEKLDDGRFNILVKGILRVRLASELPPAELYRRFRAERLDDVLPEGGPAAVEDLADGVRRMLFALCAARPGPGANALVQLATRADDASSLADIVSAALLADPPRRMKALTTLDVAERLKLAQGAVAELLVNTNEPASTLRN